MRRLMLMFAVVSVVLLAGDVLAGKPPVSPVGDWVGQGSLVLKVKKEFRDKDTSTSNLDVGQTAWTGVETAGEFTGTYTLQGRKYIWSYDAAGTTALERTLEDWIETYAAEDGGQTITATVNVTEVNTKAKTKDSKKKGKTLRVKGKVKFTVVATGDLDVTRSGIYKLKYEFTPAP